MKHLLTLILAVVASAGFSQNIWIADNRPTAPTGAHVFANVTDAITAASPGDIIHIIPSQTTYPNFTINKDSLTFFGIGFNPQKDQPNKVWVNIITIASNIFGIRISGVNVWDELRISDQTGADTNGNIFIENGDIDRIIIQDNCCTGGGSVSNLVIRNCVIGGRETSNFSVIDFVGTYYTATSVVITNNIILGSSSTGTHGSVRSNDAIIKNNLFLGNGSSNDHAFGVVGVSTVSNNVFYGRDLTPATANGISNTTFNNNISFGGTNNDFPVGVNGNSGDTTGYTNVNPIFIDVPLVDDWSFDLDPTPNTGSPLLGAGNDGNDIGVTGGTIPFSTTGTPLPIIKVLRAPEVIKQGTNLNATIEAVGN